MDIVYSSSDAYSICTGVSLYSLYNNNQDVDVLNVNILSTDISDKNKENLRTIAKEFNRSINIIDAKQDFIDEAARLHLALLRGSYNTYSRVVLNRWFSHLDRIMVIDSDTMVTGPITEAWNINLDNYLLAAAPEIAIYSPYAHQEDKDLVESLDMYYNMGICIVNLKKWREDGVDKIIESSIKRDNPVFMIADQSIINKYCAGKIARLPLKYNFYSPVHNVSYRTVNSVFSKKLVFTEEEFNSSSQSPAIIHYFGHSYERPWFKHSVALRKKDYLELKSKTPWRNYPLEKWRKSKNTIFSIYDSICYVMLCLGLFSAVLKFRCIGGQRLKSIFNFHR